MSSILGMTTILCEENERQKYYIYCWISIIICMRLFMNIDKVTTEILLATAIRISFSSQYITQLIQNKTIFLKSWNLFSFREKRRKCGFFNLNAWGRAVGIEITEFQLSSCFSVLRCIQTNVMRPKAFFCQYQTIGPTGTIWLFQQTRFQFDQFKIYFEENTIVGMNEVVWGHWTCVYVTNYIEYMLYNWDRYMEI